MTTQRTIRFTNTGLVSLRADGAKTVEYTDALVRQLKLQLTAANNKNFLVRIGVGPRGQRRKCVTKIGQFPGMEIEEARTKAMEIVVEVQRGGDPFAPVLLPEPEPKPEPPMTLNRFFEGHYYPHILTYKKSHQEDKQNFHKGIGAEHGQRPLSELTTGMIQKFLDNGSAAGWKPATRNRHFAMIHYALKLAVNWGFIERNPATGIRRLQENNRRTRFLADEELKRFLTELEVEPNKTIAMFILFLLATGLRKSEARLAKAEHLDLTQKTLWLPDTKSGEGRTVLLNDLALSTLKRVPQRKSNPYLFPGRKLGKPIIDPKITFTKVKDRAKISNFRLHDLRHTFCSLAVSNGASLYEVQHLVGHKSSVTTQRYAHLQDATLRRVSGVVAGVLQEARS